MKSDSPMFEVNLPMGEPLGREAYFASTPPAGDLTPCPRLSLGTARLGLATSHEEQEAAVALIREAWSAGFLHTDTAPRYGVAEELIGRALRGWLGREPVVATKSSVEEGGEAETAKRLRDSVSRSRARFAGRPLAMLALHDAEDCTEVTRQVCTATLVELKAEGQLHSAGLGGGGLPASQAWLPGGPFEFVLTYNRISAVTLQGLMDLSPLCRSLGVSLLAGSPLMMGLLGDRYEQCIQEGASWPGVEVYVSRARQVSRLAAESGMTLAELALRFVLSIPLVDRVVSGPCHLEHWRLAMAAYAAGPLPGDLYAAVWQASQVGAEPTWGG